MRWNDFPVVRLLTPFIAGILLSYNIDIKVNVAAVVFVSLLIALFLFSYCRRFYLPYKLRAISGSAIYLSFVVAGVLLTKLYYPYNHSDYYGHYLQTGGTMAAEVIDAPVESSKTVKVLANVKFKINDSAAIPLTGKIILYLSKNAAAENLKYGDIVVFREIPRRILPPKTPETFNYSRFMDRKGIRYYVYLRSGEWMNAGNNVVFSVKKTASQIRDILMGYFKRNGINGDEYAVASSLILGYRADISNDLLYAYRSAGVMHILCVSGMHVGIIYLIISYLLGFLKSRDFGRQIRLFVIIASVWLFALITGLSPSVTRAAVMFTFVSIGQNLGRHINIYNTLAASAMLTLIFSPYSLFEVGFLLSYVAVISIATLYKPIYSLWIPKSRILDALWKIAAISIAAQIGTAPFSVYFFHRFPNYFLITNIVVMLLITPVFYLTLISLVLSIFPPVAEFFAFLASKLIAFMNAFVMRISELPFAVTSEIHFSFIFLIMLIALIFATGIMILRTKPKMIFAVLSIVVFMLIYSISEEIKIENSKDFTAFNAGGHTAVLFRNGHQAVMVVDSAVFSHKSLIDFQTSGYLMKYGLQPVFVNIDRDNEYEGVVYRRGNVVGFEDMIFVFATGKNPCSLPEKKCNYLILNNREQNDISAELKMYLPEKVLLSSALYSWQIEKFGKQLEQEKIPYFDIKNTGTYIKEFR